MNASALARRISPVALTALLVAAAGLFTPATLRADTMPPASTVMHDAETRAQAEHKNILISFGASWCGNCHLFNHFLEDPTIQPIISKAFVTTELITGEHATDTRHSNTPGGLAYEDSLGGKNAGWPYIAILNPEGKLLIDSFRPKDGKPHAANIGYPYSPDEVDWFVHMLQVAGPNLTPADLATIHTWLSAHGVKH